MYGLDLNSWLTNNGMTLEIVVWSMFLGVMIGSFLIFFNKKVLGSFVRALIEAQAFSPETAKTLAETGFTKNFFVRTALRSRGTYRKIIQSASVAASPLEIPPAPLPPAGENIQQDSDESDKKKKKKQYQRKIIDISEMKFFIPDNMTARADSIYSDKGNSWIILLMTIGLFVLVSILSIIIVPLIVQMLNNFIEMFFPKS